MRPLVFLQNAWSPVYAGKEWPRDSWLRALQRSHSGPRLKALISDFNIVWNCTPVVSCHSSAIIKPDLDHIKRILSALEPSVVIACGREAERALAKIWSGPLLAVPHPAHRLLTIKLYVAARNMLREDYQGRLALRQRRDEKIEVEEIR